MKPFISFLLVSAMQFCPPFAAHAVETRYHTDDVRLETIELADDSLNSVLSAYLQIVQDIQEELKGTGYWETNAMGRLTDTDGNGTPELFVMYALESKVSNKTEFFSMIAESTEQKQITCLTQAHGDVTCSDGGIFLGTLDSEPVLHCLYIYQGQGSPREFGWDSVVRFSDGRLEIDRVLQWEENRHTGDARYYMNGASDESGFRETFKPTEILLGWGSSWLDYNLSDLPYQIANYS